MRCCWLSLCRAVVEHNNIATASDIHLPTKMQTPHALSNKLTFRYKAFVLAFWTHPLNNMAGNRIQNITTRSLYTEADLAARPICQGVKATRTPDHTACDNLAALKVVILGVSMCISVCVYMHTLHTHKCTNVYVHVYVDINVVSIHVFSYFHVTYMYAYIHTCICTYIHL